eukprot:m.173911 g.173911  ORF g.173911 m.173911 type:complete len:595 (+) comp16745_c0_seq13:2387-4171(+)
MAMLGLSVDSSDEDAEGFVFLSAPPVLRRRSQMEFNRATRKAYFHAVDLDKAEVDPDESFEQPNDDSKLDTPVGCPYCRAMMRDRPTLSYHIRYFHILAAGPPSQVDRHTFSQLKPRAKPYSAKRRAALHASQAVHGAPGRRAIKRATKLPRKSSTSADNYDSDDHSRGARTKIDRVPMIHRWTGRIVSGTAAPARKNVTAWLARNPDFKPLTDLDQTLPSKQTGNRTATSNPPIPPASTPCVSLRGSQHPASSIGNVGRVTNDAIGQPQEAAPFAQASTNPSGSMTYQQTNPSGSITYQQPTRLFSRINRPAANPSRGFRNPLVDSGAAAYTSHSTAFRTANELQHATPSTGPPLSTSSSRALHTTGPWAPAYSRLVASQVAPKYSVAPAMGGSQQAQQHGNTSTAPTTMPPHNLFHSYLPDPTTASQCPLPGCNSKGHSNGISESHTSLQDCPLTPSTGRKPTVNPAPPIGSSSPARPLSKTLPRGAAVEVHIGRKWVDCTVVDHMESTDVVRLSRPGSESFVSRVSDVRLKAATVFSRNVRSKASAFSPSDTSERPYRCIVDGCTSSYKGPSGLFYHMKSIHPEVDYGGKR